MFSIEVIKKKELLEAHIGKTVTVMCSGKIVKGFLLSVELSNYQLKAVIDHSKAPVSWGREVYKVTTSWMNQDGFGPLVHTEPSN